jgi:hypothetical protein
MGNRAVIATRVEGVPKEYSPAIYVHWNGGRDSVESFLKIINEKLEVRSGDYGWARLIQTITNFFGGSLSVGAGVITRMDQDNYDNGVYWLDFTKNGWEIVGREFFENRKEQQEYDIDRMANDIWEDCFPKNYHDPENVVNKFK